MNLFGSLAYGLANLLHPRMLWLMLWPMLVAAGFWGLVAFALWARAALWLAGQFKQWMDSAVFFLQMDFGTAAYFLANFLLVILFVPLVLLTALALLSVFGMPQIVEHVASRSFPALERHATAGIAGSVRNAIAAGLGMAALGLATLPLWLVPPLWPAIPVVILAWVNQRLLRYDALAEHAEPIEMRLVFREQRGALYALGLLLALVAYIPIVGFFAPVLFGLAFAHYLLGALYVRRLHHR